MDGKEMIDMVRKIDEKYLDASENYRSDEKMIQEAMKGRWHIKAAAIALAAVLCAAVLAVLVIKPKITDEKRSEENTDNVIGSSNDKKTKETYLIDQEESKKIYKELTEEERELQIVTSMYIGYQHLTDQQYEELAKIKKDYEKMEGMVMPYRELLAIGAAPSIKDKLTLDDVKRIISESDTLEIAEEKITENRYPSLIKYNGHNDQMPLYEYWLDDKGNEAIGFYYNKIYGEKEELINGVKTKVRGVIKTEVYRIEYRKGAWTDGWNRIDVEPIVLYDEGEESLYEKYKDTVDEYKKIKGKE